MTVSYEVRPLRPGEEAAWGALRIRLWPHCGPKDNEEDMAALGDPAGALRVVFLAFFEGVAIGFAEISERSVVDGAGNGPAAHLEGWYVDPECRRRGIGAALVRAAAGWARQQGYAYFGSDVELDNPVSQKAHEALGFEEQGRVVNYLMALDK